MRKTLSTLQYGAVIAGLASMLALLVSSPVFAQDGPASQEGKFIPQDVSGVEEGKAPGWHPFLKGSANLSLSHNDNVVGTPDGTNLNFGFLINGALDYLSLDKQHEWTNSLNWQLGFTRTPLIDKVVKNLDGLDFETTYLYHIPAVPWLGPFASFQLKTVVFKSDAIFAEDKDVVRYLSNGQPENGFDNDDNPIPTTIEAKTKIRLTKAFSPTTLRESLGIFAKPVEKPLITLDFRVGWGFWETFVRNGYAIEDAGANPLVLRRMEDVVELGPELRIGAKGNINEFVTYAAKALFMYPVYQSEDNEFDGIDKLNTEFEFLLGVKLAEWASLDYTFKAYKLPVIFDGWQVQNGLLLSLNVSIVGE
ncbi:MAG: hypothetical protein QNJ97_01670 [Myxococcota bacterium]|nr:hypothetical protein [Myxococcota bacterium]